MKRFLFFLAVSVFGLGSALAQDGTKLEAEDAIYENCELVEGDQYSGGKALAMKESNGKISFNYTAAEGGKFTVYVGYDGQWGDKTVNITVNGSTGTFQTPVAGVGEIEVGAFIMNEGENTIEITPSWTWYLIDYISVGSSSESGVAFDIASAPVDGNACEAAKKVYTFLYENFGKKTISGMMTGDMGSANGDITQHEDVKAVFDASGKYPALVGFDFLFATGRTEDEGWCKDYTNKSIALAKDLYRRGGLPAFTWHWHDPSRATDDFYSDKNTVKIADALNADGSWNTESELYQYLVKDIHTIADYFLQLQEAGVACIFRPLHEASGGWFWWGRDKNAEAFVKLYHLVFDEMVNEKGVHNIIWVWNAGENDADWNPGDTYYDIVSADIYNAAFDYSSNYSTFDKLKSLTGGKKIITLSENGPIPDIDKEVEEEAVWSWWMPWYQTWDGKFVEQTSTEEWTKCMNDERVITLEDLSEGWGTYIETGIQSLKAVEPASQTIYDLQGRRLTTVPAKGLYIKDGKKFVVK